MPKKQNISAIDLRPEVRAAELTEQRLYSAEEICIHPQEGMTGSQYREIVGEGYDKHRKGYLIETKSKSEHRSQLEKHFSQEASLKPLLEVVEQEIALFRLQMQLRERAELLGMPAMQPGFFDMPGFLDAEEQRVLAFFLPYRVTIQGNMVLMEKCLTTAIQLPLKVKQGTPKVIEISEAKADKATLDIGLIAGGKSSSRVPCLDIAIGPAPMRILSSVAPGGKCRLFLEKALLPVLLPEGWDWRITVTTEPSQCRFLLPEAGEELRLGINSIVNT